MFGIIGEGRLELECVRCFKIFKQPHRLMEPQFYRSLYTHFLLFHGRHFVVGQEVKNLPNAQ